MVDSTHAPILQVDGLVVRYGSRTAVDGLSLVVERGEIFGLLGPNGAGKTSTLSAVEGLLSPAAGGVQVVGHDAAAEPLAVRALIGVQLQASSFQAELTLTEILRLYAGLYGLTLSGDELSERLRRAGLADEAGKRYKQTSGGQQQRFSLLVAMLHDPPLLLLDEPTSGLDPQARRQLWSQIERARRGRLDPADHPLDGGGGGGLRPGRDHRPRPARRAGHARGAGRPASGRPAGAPSGARGRDSRGRVHRPDGGRDP